MFSRCKSLLFTRRTLFLCRRNQVGYKVPELYPEFFLNCFISSATAARLLRGSVSDGSEESLATSEGDSENGLSRHAAPVSPLVGPIGMRGYRCHPSVIPGHFRHRITPSALTGLAHLYPGEAFRNLSIL